MRRFFDRWLRTDPRGLAAAVLGCFLMALCLLLAVLGVGVSS